MTNYVIGVWRKILPGCVVILGQISALVSGGPQCNYCFTTADKEILRYWPADHPVMFTVDQQSPAVLQHGGVQTLQLQDKHQVQQQLSQNKDYRQMSRSRSRRWGRQRTSTLTTGSSGWRETSPGWRSSTARWWRRSTLRLTLSNTGTEVGCNTNKPRTGTKRIPPVTLRSFQSYSSNWYLAVVQRWREQQVLARDISAPPRMVWPRRPSHPSWPSWAPCPPYRRRFWTTRSRSCRQPFTRRSQGTSISQVWWTNKKSKYFEIIFENWFNFKLQW